MAVAKRSGELTIRRNIGVVFLLRKEVCSEGRIVDAGSHFMAPLDVVEHYSEPQFRLWCLHYVMNPIIAGVY